MSETKDEIAAHRDRLLAENAELQRRLDAAGRPNTAPAAQHTFFLTEGARQELAQNGVATIGGKLMTRDEVQAELDVLGEDRIELGDAEPSQEMAGAVHLARARARTAVPGVDYVYPSVRPGEIDPAVAGTPGINGPAAENATAPAEAPVEFDDDEERF